MSSFAGNGSPLRYTVDMSGQTKTLIKDLHERARAAGVSKRFLAALQQIVERLQKAPFDLGEPLFRLPVAKLVVCHAIVDILAVDFAIHEEKPFVFINGFKLLV